MSKLLRAYNEQKSTIWNVQHKFNVDHRKLSIPCDITFIYTDNSFIANNTLIYTRLLYIQYNTLYTSTTIILLHIAAAATEREVLIT